MDSLAKKTFKTIELDSKDYEEVEKFLLHNESLIAMSGEDIKAGRLRGLFKAFFNRIPMEINA